MLTQSRRLESFTPGALILCVQRRHPMRDGAEWFGFDTVTLSSILARLRRDDPDFPVKRRSLRGRIYVEPCGPGGSKIGV